MDYLILGLLILSNRTIYQLRERLNKGLNLMYSSSMGSIQAALKKLLNCGYIQYAEIVDNGKYKKEYSITENGKQCFFEWINAPIKEQGFKCPDLVKLYFMGFAEKENREVAIQNYLTFLKEQFCMLDTICEDAKNIEIPENGKDIFNYQFLSALYGKDLFQFNVEWFENILKKMRNDEI
ncbi:MAG TPA: PadR family transcriptional regulator [Clostridiales bacterium]|nr:PadR family transcriptional regulator [Clostridiales bacterium]